MANQQNARNAPNKGFKGKRGPRKMSPSMEEAIKLVKPLRGRNKVFGMMSTNDRGTVTEVGVYNGNTKRYALYRSELVDAEIISEFKEIMGSNSQ
jgi:tryptophanyl-tRNA synthetase